MPFARYLDPGFINALNTLYQDQSSWWYAIASDRKVFVGVRNNAINAYFGGGSIARIEWLNDGLTARVHSEYLTLPANETYVNIMDEPREVFRSLVTDSRGFQESYRHIKGRARRFGGKERDGENAIASNHTRIVDMEAVYEGGEIPNLELDTDDPEQYRPGRLDLVVCTSDGQLVFHEAKLYSNSDLRSRGNPAVCDQLQDYYRWLTQVQNQEDIVKAYKNVLSYFGQLDGVVFKGRGQALEQLSVDPIPRLLVFGFDTTQRQRLREIVVPQIVENCKIPGFCGDHVRTVGGPENVQGQHLS